MVCPVSAQVSTLPGGKGGNVFHCSASGGVMIVCSGLSGLAAVPVMPSGSAAMRDVNTRSRRLACHSMRDLPVSQSFGIPTTPLFLSALASASDPSLLRIALGLFGPPPGLARGAQTQPGHSPARRVPIEKAARKSNLTESFFLLLIWDFSEDKIAAYQATR